MLKAIQMLALAAVVVALGTTARAADTYAVDPVHSSITFMVPHGAELSYIHGRFNDFSGKFTIDKENPSKSTFLLEIKVDTVDTNNVKRDEHLRAPDYFDTKQFPLMTFKSTKVNATSAGFEVTGDLTMHGVTKPISLNLKGGHREGDFKGQKRIGIVTTTMVKRSEFGLTTSLPALGDEIQVVIGIEANKE